MANIKNNNVRKIDCRLINDEYFDFMLSKDEGEINSSLEKECFATSFNFNKNYDKHIISNVSWEGAIASDKILENIGFTGIDNGFIIFQKDRISNEEFLDIFTNSSFDLSTYGDKFFMTEVSGNTKLYTYPIEKYDDYVSLKGGFYQGFFKIYDDKYKTLPTRLNSEWNFNFTLRVKDYETPYNTLNNRYPENKGIFFYIGTRAENKFAELYNKEEKDESIDNDYFLEDGDVLKHSYLDTMENKELNENKDTIKTDLRTYNYNRNNCGCKNNDEQIKEEENNCDIYNTDDYFVPEINLEKLKIADSEGVTLDSNKYTNIETDNKFIIFNKTNTGFTIDTWKEDYKYVMTMKNKDNINYYPYLNKTCTGYTIDNIHLLDEQMKTIYTDDKEITNNAFALKINEDGSIGYKYLTKSDSCELEVIEEKSYPNLIKKDEWVNIHLKIVRKPNSCDDCEKNYNFSKMQLYFYVNGYLKFISKELPELELKSLNDLPERQEGVPYNMSIGGGTQGLSERIMLNYYDLPKENKLLEKNFAGTFIGDIKDFNFISCQIDINQIREIEKIKGELI